jgi:hypothetical protein
VPGRREPEAGSAVVEFALVLPIVFLVLLAAVQVGLLARDQVLLTAAARAGAREAAVSLDDVAVREATIGAAQILDPDRLQLRIDRAGSLGAAVTVTLDYEAPVAIPIAGWLLPGTVDLRAAATMRQEVT